jgi:hypothetical protein
MDRDTELLQESSLALIALHVRFKEAPLLEKLKLKPVIDEAIDNFAALQRKLLAEGTITSADDLAEIAEIKSAIDAAASNQQLIAAGTRFLGLIAKFA